MTAIDPLIINIKLTYTDSHNDNNDEVSDEKQFESISIDYDWP
jgi:hypothetical protein